MKIQDLIVKTEKVKWQDLKDLQPENLKTNLHSEKTKKSIIELGFAQAIYVWQNPETNELKICDGHMRADLLRELVAEGFEVPEKLNCTFLDNTKIKTEQEAIKYLLRVFNVKRNPIDTETLENWLEDIDLSVDDIAFDDLDLKFEVVEFNITNNKSEQTADTKDNIFTQSSQLAGNFEGTHGFFKVSLLFDENQYGIFTNFIKSNSSDDLYKIEDILVNFIQSL